MTAAPKMVVSDQDAVIAFSQVAQELTGVQLNARHSTMVESRLLPRARELGLVSLAEYWAYFDTNRGTEIPKVVGLLTTHHTFFFREFVHFEYLRDHALKVLAPIVAARPDKTLRIWSAACSRGQEAYSLSMFLQVHLKEIDPSLKYEILGTDIDAESVKVAENGVYLREDLKNVPLHYLGNHWMKGTGAIEAFAKAKETIKSPITFRPGNLFELPAKPSQLFDLIFCRNVFIYFTPDQIRSITHGLLNHLQPQGFLMVGLSESLKNHSLPIESHGPSIYRKPQPKTSEVAKATTKPGTPTASKAPPVAKPIEVPNPLRVLCVDDSGSILTLLKRILGKDHGFEVVGVAKNGKEAAEQADALKPHLMTLDIHMPEATGIDYLEKYRKSSHPPVVMVTSVSRDDIELGTKALKLGAADYVEKPELTNLEEKGDELRTKLRCAFVMGAKAAAPSSLDSAFAHQHKTPDTESTLRVVAFPLASTHDFLRISKELKGPQPPLLLLIDAAEPLLKDAAARLSSALGKSIEYVTAAPPQWKKDTLYLSAATTGASWLGASLGKRKTSLMLLGRLSAKPSRALADLKNVRIIVEDLGPQFAPDVLSRAANDVMPATSFIYTSNEYLSGEKA